MRYIIFAWILSLTSAGQAQEKLSQEPLSKGCHLILSPQEAEVQLLPLKSISNPMQAALIQQLFKNRLALLSADTSSQESLSKILAMLGEIESQGFSAEELLFAKQQLLATCQAEATQEERAYVANISQLEIWEEVKDLLSDEKLHLAFSSSEKGNLLLTRKQAELFALFLFNPRLAEGAGASDEDEDLEDPFMAPTEQPVNPDLDNADFYQLPLHDWEKQTIAYIITNMADKNVFQLLLEKKDMERKGKKINQVHPLRFIGYVCSDLRLKRFLRLIKKNTFKWDGFIDGFSGRMREEASRGNLQRFVPDFAAQVGVDPVDIMPFIQRVDCDGLVRFIVGATN